MLEHPIIDPSSILPQSRRRAYSDSTKFVLRPLLRRFGSPPPNSSSPTFVPTSLSTIEARVPLSTNSEEVARTSPPNDISVVGSPPRKGIMIPGSPGSPSQSRYAGIVVGSPLGSGPLNGQHLTSLDMSPACSLDNIPGTSPPTTCDISPRSRIPSVSEQPSVAPIPENLVLEDTPQTVRRRPGLFSSFSVDSGATNASSVNSAKSQQAQQANRAKDGSKDDSSGLEDQSSLAPVSRPRAGTWSLANSRRAKKERAEKEEEARLRVRRKSGDDIHKLDATAAGATVSSFMRRKGAGDGATHGFFDSFRPRSKSDAKAILNARQRRRSGDDALSLPQGSTPAKDAFKDRKKDASPGLFESIRPRSKSDAARLASKKPNFMSNIKQAVQHSLVSPVGGRGMGGRRSGESTPPYDAGRPHVPSTEHGQDYHHYTWHAGGADKKSSLFKVLDLFRSGTDDKKRKPINGKNERGRRNSGDLHDRSRPSSTSGSLSSVYIRGSMNPDVVAGVFREARRLPAVDSLVITMLGQEEESQILVKFFQLHRSYDLIPTSAKLVIFDTSLQVKKAFYALVHNGVRAAPLWDHTKQKFVGMLTITDFIRILQSFHHNHDPQMETLEDHRLHEWRTMLHDEDRPLISISPSESLYDAIKSIIHHRIHRLPVIDETTGNVLYIITHKRIIKFLYLYIRELPQPSILNKTIGELELGTYSNIETASPDTLIIEALDKFVERRISALPIVDEKGVLVDIYAKFDVLNLAAEGTYHNLDVTLSKANESRNEWFEGVLSCTRNESLRTVMDRIVSAEVHRLVVVDEDKKVVGVLSLSDILKELVLKPSENKAAALKEAALLSAVSDVTKNSVEVAVPQSPSPADTPPEVDSLIISSLSPDPKPGSKGAACLGDSEDEGRYSMDKSEGSPPPTQQT